MSAKKLGKLEQLAGKRAEQSRVQLAHETQALHQIDSHHSELRAINTEYQQAMVGNDEVAPQLLAHRRAFVSQLTQKLDELLAQKSLKQETVKQRAREHEQRSAQHTAIDLIHKQRTRELEQLRLRREQQQLDESASQLYYQNQALKDEYDHE